MARRPLIAGNWKMHMTPAEGAELVRQIAAGQGATRAEVVVCPTFLGLTAAVAAAGTAIGVGGQNCHWEAKGAFTGEIPAAALVAAGCRYVVLGHSERRQYFGETDATVNKRLKAALGAGLVPLLCIGETLAERQGNQLQAVLERQVRGALDGLTPAQLETLVIAYEPVWAIGTGVVATTAQAQEAHAFVRSLLVQVVGAELAAKVRILYGGSVKADNAVELLAQPDIDGALVGGASLTAAGFLPIIAAA
jgi:triosephosphate isomerase